MQARHSGNRGILGVLFPLVCAVGPAWTTPAAAMEPAQNEPDWMAKDHPRHGTDDSDEPDASKKANAETNRGGLVAEKAILAKWKKLHGFSAHIIIETGTGKIISKPGEDKWEPQMQVQGEGTYEVLKKNDKSLIRMELESESRIRHIGDNGPSHRSLMRLYDGEFVYSVGKEGGKTHASKVKRPDDAFILLGGPDLFKKLRKQLLLRPQPDEVLGTRKTIVFEGKPKKGDGKTKCWFDQDTGILVKLAMFDRAGKLRNRLTLDQIKIDPKFHPKRFVFIPPKGVEVKDLSNRNG